jgi:hypothetical protein
MSKAEQLEIPGSEGTPAQQVLSVVKKSVGEHVEKLFGSVPKGIDAVWYNKLKDKTEIELIAIFESGLRAGMALATSGLNKEDPNV